MIHINDHNHTKFYSVVFYNKEGVYHRIDGPAIIDGNCELWYLNGKLHRIGGPAIIRANFEAWFENDERIK